MKVKLQIVFLFFLMLTTMFSCKNCCKEDMEFIKKQNSEILKKLENISKPSSNTYELNKKITSLSKINLGQNKNFKPFDFITSIKTNTTDDSTEIKDFTISFIAHEKEIKSIVLKQYLIKEKKHIKNVMRYVVKYEDSPKSQLVSFNLDASNFKNNEEAKEAFEYFISGKDVEILKVKLKPNKIGVGNMGTERTGIATTTNEVPEDEEPFNTK